jgi:hypothetical protein
LRWSTLSPARPALVRHHHSLRAGVEAEAEESGPTRSSRESQASCRSRDTWHRALRPSRRPGSGSRNDGNENESSGIPRRAFGGEMSKLHDVSRNSDFHASAAETQESEGGA